MGLEVDFQQNIEAALNLSSSHRTTKDSKGKGKSEDRVGSLGRGSYPTDTSQ